MSPYNRSWHDTKDTALSTNVRPLTPAEIDQVSGGIVPILVAAIAVLAATVVQEVGDRLSDDGEDKSDD